VDQEEWGKHENWNREHKSILRSVPLTPVNSGMWGFDSMEREVNAQFDDDEWKKRDLDTPDVPYNYHSGDYAKKMGIQADSIFERIKIQCLSNPFLIEKVIKLGVNYLESNQMTQKNIVELSRGRYWITANSAQPDGDKQSSSFKEDLDDLQGCYQEVDKGVLQQSIPQGREAAVHHRLFKYNLGLWAIDKWEAGAWRPVVRENINRLWVDLRYNTTIHVKVIPLLTILRSMGQNNYANRKIDKCVEFLFTSFDRKKPYRKLKTRPLRYKIANLKLELEKQYALNFAVNVATTANSISGDDKTYLCPEENSKVKTLLDRYLDKT